LFFPGSRYAALMRYQKRRADGSVVQVTRLPLPSPPVVLGFFRRVSGQRLDLIASRFLSDATAFWRLCDASNAVVPDALANRDLVGIPIDAKVRS
jgi:ABC-type molybdate transport system permease subunit